MESVDKIKIRVQRTIVWISAALLAGKFIAFFVTNSVGILTDAMESIVNVVAGAISLYSLHIASKPKDEGHPFGHGKVEFISASVEGIMIAVAGCLIIYEGVKRLFEPSPVQSLDLGIIIVAAAGLINYVVGWYSIRVGKKYDSVALVAGGKHLQSDTYSTIGLVVGLIMLYITKLHWIDSALAIIFGSIIITTGIQILRGTVSNLLDKSDKQTLNKFVEAVSENQRSEWIDIHNTKIIKYGSFYHIDCDLTVPWYYTIRSGHESYEFLKNAVAAKFDNRIMISVHLDPCKENHCPHCGIAECQHRLHSFASKQPLTIELSIKSDE